MNIQNHWNYINNKHSSITFNAASGASFALLNKKITMYLTRSTYHPLLLLVNGIIYPAQASAHPPV